MLLTTLTRKFTAWQNQRTAIARLHALDDRLLRDLGVSRDAIAQVVTHGTCI